MEFLFSEDKICITGALGAPVENSLKIVKKKLVVLSWHTSGANLVQVKKASVLLWLCAIERVQV
jgi:hypothetical protein